jgi:uncharacterized membrane protein YtjA (UPF0391 family)
LTGVIPPRGSSGPGRKVGFVPFNLDFLLIFVRGTTRNLRSNSGLFSQPARAAPGRADPENGIENRGCVMLSWVVTFLIIALIAGILGFGGVAGASIEIAKIIFFVAIVLFLVSAVVSIARGRTRV